MDKTTPRLLAEGLRFPEGPVATRDDSVVLVEIAAGRITRVDQDGGKSVVATRAGAEQMWRPSALGRINPV